MRQTTSLIEHLPKYASSEKVDKHRRLFFFQHTYFSEHFIRALARLSIWNDAEHKLDQVDHVLETEGAETKLVLYSLLCKMRNNKNR